MTDGLANIAAAISWFSRHLVSLECTYTVLHRDKAPEAARTYFSGFLIMSRPASTG